MSEKEFERHEIFVINAMKGRFQGVIFSNFAAARKIINRIVFGIDGEANPISMLQYLRGILIKAGQFNRWEDKTVDLLRDAQTELTFNKHASFMDCLIARHLVAIQGLRIQSGDERLIILTMLPDEEKEINEALGGEK